MELKVIWKNQLEKMGMNFVTLPADSIPLHVGEQDGRLTIWSEVHPNRQSVQKPFLVVGTGEPISENVGIRDYIGTVRMPDGLVWHVYEVTQ